MSKHLYIFNESDSNAGGYGVGTYINTLIHSGINQLFDQMTIVSVMTNALIVEVIYDGKIRKINIPKLFPPTASRKNYFQSIFYILYPLIEKNEINYFHFNFFPHGRLARKLKENIEDAKFILTIHYFNEYEFLETGANIDIANSLYDKIIVLNDTTRGILQNKYSAKTKNLIKILNGIKDEYSLINDKKRIEIIKEFGLLEDQIQLLFVGRLDENKNVSLLIKSFIKLCSIYENINLNIVGSGSYDMAFNAIDSLWGKITFLGKLEKESVYKLYQITDIGIIPSIYEELGYVAIEMMMHGIPVVANNTGGLRDIIRDGETGMLLKITDSKNENSVELYKKIQCLIENKRIRTQIGSKGREFYLKNLTDEIYVEKMANLYLSL